MYYSCRIQIKRSAMMSMQLEQLACATGGSLNGLATEANEGILIPAIYTNATTRKKKQSGRPTALGFEMFPR